MVKNDFCRSSEIQKWKSSDFLTRLETGDCTNMLLGQKQNGKIISSYFTKTHIVYSYKILKRRVVLHKASNIRKEHLIQFPRQSIFVLVFTFDLYLYLSFATEGQEPRKEEGD